MDFSYFTAAPQPYPYFALPPTSATRNTPQLDEFTHPQPNEHYDPAFAAFQQNYQYDPSTFMAQPQQIQEQPNIQHLRHDSSLSQPDVTIESGQPSGPDMSFDEAQAGRSSSEERDNLTPQQNKRKAQNRAAQRAFRERKERHVKDLETRNTTLKHESVALQNENERLRRELAKFATENEILRATSGSSSNRPSPFLADPDELVGPLAYTPTDYSSKLRSSTNGLDRNWTPNAKWAQFGTLPAVAVEDDSGEPLLTAAATWDYIQAHELFQKGLVDVGDVCQRIKKMAKCDGQGPVFQENDIRQAISESAVAGGRDELL